MQENTIRGLAAMPPPPKLSKLRFQKHADCFEEISRLEGLLGVAHSKPPNNIVAANARASELERLVNLQVTQTAPAPAAAAPAPAPELKGRDRFMAAAAKAGEHKPSKTVFSHLKGRDRFMAAAALANSKKI